MKNLIIMSMIVGVNVAFAADMALSAAFNQCRKLAEQGIAVAENNLGVMYMSGSGVEKDYAEAIKWFRKAAEQGVALAQHNIGFMYENGNGVAKDEVEAVKWYRKAAEQGLDRAENNLGVMYLNGRGVAKDYAEAIKWFRKAAEQGVAPAQHNIGFMYENGKGVAKDEVEAVKWYRKAAERGFAESENSLGVMYFYGRGGVAKDCNEAIKWLYRAVEHGCAMARINLEKCEMQRQSDLQAEKRRVEAAELMVDKLRGAVTCYMMDQGKSRPPANLNDLINDNANGGSYIKGGVEDLVDPWGNEYRIKIRGKRFVIISNGPDGRTGTNDDIRSDRKK